MSTDPIFFLLPVDNSIPYPSKKINRKDARKNEKIFRSTPFFWRKPIDTPTGLCYNNKAQLKHLGVAQLEARYLGVVEAAGSNPVTQTKKAEQALACSAFLDFSDCA